MARLTVEGVDFTPYVKSYSIGIMDLDVNATRNVLGDLIRNRVAVKRKISVSLAPVSGNVAQRLLSAIAAESFSVTFTDPQLGEVIRRMYVSDRTSPYLNLETDYWNGISFELVEI